MDPIVKNAVRCTMCGHGADRYDGFFLCTNPECGAFGDLFVGIFTRLDRKYYEDLYKDKSLTFPQN
jgi:hypothetical protein